MSDPDDKAKESGERSCVNTETKFDRHIRDLRHWWLMKRHSLFWGFLNITRLNRPYSKLTCRLGLYRKFPDGRCMYCGAVH